MLPFRHCYTGSLEHVSHGLLPPRSLLDYTILLLLNQICSCGVTAPCAQIPSHANQLYACLGKDMAHTGSLIERCNSLMLNWKPASQRVQLTCYNAQIFEATVQQIDEAEEPRRVEGVSRAPNTAGNLATARLGEFALRLGGRTTLETLSTSDLLLTFGNVVKVVRVDIFADVLLSLSRRAVLDGTFLSCDVLFGLGD